MPDPRVGADEGPEKESILEPVTAAIPTFCFSTV